MIPYSIEHVFSRENDLYTKFDYIERNKLNGTVINIIVEFIREFCYRRGIQITSYKDFCDKFWNEHELADKNDYYIFKVTYFEQKWTDWNIEEFQEEIYLTYTDKYKKKK